MIDVIIIGAGASGMMVAIKAAKNKKVKVTILEHSYEAGKKLLATGNGRCNLTNTKISEDYFRSHDRERIKRLLEKYNTDSIIDFFFELGMICCEKNGYIYPYSYQASTVRDILLNECVSNGVQIITDCHVIGVEKEEDKFAIRTSMGYTSENGERKKKREKFYGDRIVIACGSKAYPKLGSDGSGYGIAKELGLKIYPVVPALTGLKCKEDIYRLASGVRTGANIDLFVDHEKMASDTGEIQLTDYGISGIPVFQVSRYASYGIAEGCKVHGIIDFMPEYEESELRKILTNNVSRFSEKSIYDILLGMINSKLAKMILAYCRIGENKLNPKINETDIDDIIRGIKRFYTVITGTNDYEQSQVCAGGISLSEVDDCFQSKKIPGVYIVGEILDVDGMCGGYNLHWAWISGMIAGEDIGK